LSEKLSHNRTRNSRTLLKYFDLRMVCVHRRMM